LLLRPQTIIAAQDPVIASRPALSQVGIQLVNRGGVVWAQKGAWLRNQPFTAVFPHNGQIQGRLHFASLAHAAKGKRGLDPETGLPGAASEIAKRMGGYRAPARLSKPYPSEIRKTFRTEADLKRLAAARKISVA
jgi:hypothetical protein